MSIWSQTPPYPNVVRIAAVCLTIWILYVAQDLIIPMTIAVLISYVFAPIVRKLKLYGLPPPLSSTIVTTAIGLILLGLVILTSSQLLDLSQKLPQYKENLVDRIRSVKSSTSHSLTNLQSTVDTIQHELASTTAPSEKPAIPPVPVQVVAGENDWFSVVSVYVPPALKPLTQCSVILLLVFFILMSLDLIEAKIKRFASRYDLYQASEAMEEASVMLGKYLRTQLMINLGYGIAVALAMKLFGLPNYVMWGILCAALRYLPYVGPTIAVIMPTLLCIAISPNWNQPILFLSTILFIELAVNVFVEPLLYGNRTGVSSLGVVVSTLFWGWLWGAAGLVLAMPITASLVVIGKHLRPLESIADLLGSEDPPQKPAEKIEPDKPAELIKADTQPV